MATEIFLVVYFIFNLAMMGTFFFLLNRSEKVRRFRLKLLDEVGDACGYDNMFMRDWEWRFDVLNEVTYDQMVYQFWRPLTIEGFYKDRSFLDKSSVRTVSPQKTPV